jgi:ketosteroid isomerase-like protein
LSPHQGPPPRAADAAEERELELVRRLFDAFDRRDVHAALALFAPDVRFEPASTEVAERRPYNGHAGIRDYFHDLERTWDRLEVTLNELRRIPPHVLAFGRIYAAAGGYVTDDPASFLLRVVGERVVWGKVFRSRAEALEAAGR